MNDIDATINAVRETAKRVGLPTLAREADVPYTTVQTFAKRDWGHKNLDVLKKLIAASERLAANDAATQERAA